MNTLENNRDDAPPIHAVRGPVVLTISEELHKKIGMIRDFSTTKAMIEAVLDAKSQGRIGDIERKVDHELHRQKIHTLLSAAAQAAE